MKNKAIRNAITCAGLRYWEVAKEIGVSPYTLSIWLREELSGERRSRVEAAIEKLRKERAAG